MKQEKNCFECKKNHITFKNDSLIFQFAKSKGHQNGEETVGPLYVYANPMEPHLCAHLSVAKYLITYPQLFLDGIVLF